MTEAEYIIATRRTDPEGGYTRDGAIARRMADNPAILHYVLGIVTEAGELADAVKKALIYGRDLDKVNLLEEVGDLQWYEARLLDFLGHTFADARARNIAKLRRRYPDGFTEQDATVRDLAAERQTLEGPQPDGFDRAPEHYAGEREVIDQIRDSMSDVMFVAFCVGNALKYECRAGKKGDTEGDANKAKWYRAMARHVDGGGPDPRCTRPGWRPEVDGYVRQGKPELSLATTEAVDSLARWLWPDLHAVDGRVDHLVERLERIVATDRRLVDVAVAAILATMSTGADPALFITHTKPDEFAEHVAILKEKAERHEIVEGVLNKARSVLRDVQAAGVIDPQGLYSVNEPNDTLGVVLLRQIDNIVEGQPAQPISRILRELADVIDHGCPQTGLAPERLAARIEGLFGDANGGFDILGEVVLNSDHDGVADSLSEYGLLDG